MEWAYYEKYFDLSKVKTLRLESLRISRASMNGIILTIQTEASRAATPRKNGNVTVGAQRLRGGGAKSPVAAERVVSIAIATVEALRTSPHWDVG